jgi:hypothetical protein
VIGTPAREGGFRSHLDDPQDGLRDVVRCGRSANLVVDDPQPRLGGREPQDRFDEILPVRGKNPAGA